MRWITSAGLALGLISLTTEPQVAAAQAAEQVQSSALKAPDVWQLGQAGDAALPATLWQNSNATVVGALMDKLKAPFPSPIATRLARAAMLTGGAPPAGSEVAAGEAARKRFAALGRFGAADEIAAMSAVATDAFTEPNMLAFAAQADLARGRASDACRRAQASQAGTAFVLTLRAYCVAATRQQLATDVALEVATGAGAKDPWLSPALGAVSGANAHGPAAKFDSSLNAAISIAGKLKPAPSPFAKASLLAVDVVARDADAPEALRVTAAQIALRQFAIDAGAARDAFAASVAAKPGKIAAAAPAALLRAIAAATDSAGKAKAISAALAKTTSYTDFATMARLAASDIAALPHNASTAPYAATMTRASLALGDVKGAVAWRDQAAQSAPQSMIGPQRALDCAVIVAGGGNDAAARAAIERRIEFAGPAVARDVALMEALGLPIPARASALLAATAQPKTQKPADPAILADLTDSARRNAAGETAINAARALSPGAHTLDRASLVSVIQALRAVKLEAFARQVAVEAMVAGGVE